MHSFLVLSLAGAFASGTIIRSNTPPMGWNSYNYYNCHPTESIIKDNAVGLVTLGLDKLGYNIVTTDCGWSATYREADNLVWNPTLFPKGGKDLGDFIKGQGLKFGVYSGGGIFQCGSTDQPASLGFEEIDAKAFAALGADFVKYDNCFADSTTVAADSTNAVSVSPDRFVKMAGALNATDKEMQYAICQWGIGTDIGKWAPEIAGTWRMSNDIYNAWRSIWRITNQVVPYYIHTQVGAYPDMDMLLVGLGALSHEEERFHFGMWAINKSPLFIGAPTNPDLTPPESLAILANPEVIAINQDPNGDQAQLVRRDTEREWDIWLGQLSDHRKVLGIANWSNDSQTVTVLMSEDLGIESATARDVWAQADVGKLTNNYTADLAGHEMRLLVLSDVVDATEGIQTDSWYYEATKDAELLGDPVVTTCEAGDCLPIGTKVGSIGEGQSLTFPTVVAGTAGKKLLGIDYIHYDIATDSAWGFGDNTRNMTIQVNQAKATRFAFPISGGNWYQSGRLYVYVDGFEVGTGNDVVFSNGGVAGSWAPDLVGFEIFEVK